MESKERIPFIMSYLKKTKGIEISIPAFMVLCVLLVNFLLHFFFFFVVKYQDSVILLLDIWSLFALVVFIIAIKRQFHSFNYVHLWVVMAYLFYLGQYYCVPFGVNADLFDFRWSLFSGTKEYVSILKNYFYTIESINIIVLFCIIIGGRNKVRSGQISEEYRPNNFTGATRIVSKTIALICLVPTFIYKAYAVYLGVKFDYGTMKFLTGRGMVGGIQFLSYFSGFLMPACYMWLVSAKTNKERNFIRGILIIYAIMVIASGSRYEALEVACAFLLIEAFWFKSITRRKIVFISIGAAVLIIMFSYVKFARVNGSSAGFEVSKDVIFDALFGDSAPAASINYAVIDYESKFHDYLYGVSYLYGVVSVLFSSIRNALFPNFHASMDMFSEYLGVTTANMGSSIIAEAFYNFGWFSLCLFMPILGGIFGKIAALQSNRTVENMNPYRFASYVFLCSILLFAIRSDFATIIRTYIIYALFPILLIRITHSILVRRNRT